MPPKKRTPATNKKRSQSTLFQSDPSIKRTKVHEQYVRTEILLDDSIYGRNIPESAKGKWFLYTVYGYDSKSDTYSAKYGKQAIDPESTVFVAFAEGDDGILSGLKLETIKIARSRYLTITNKTKAIENEKKDKVRKELEEAAKEPSKVDLSDIDKIVEGKKRVAAHSNPLKLSLKR